MCAPLTLADFGCLGNGRGDIRTFRDADSDAGLTVTDDHESTETEAAAAFYDAGYAVDVQRALIELLLLRLEIRTAVAAFLGFLLIGHG
jgi:hypothetical protein